MAIPQLHSLFWQAKNPSQAVDGYVVRIWQKTIYLGGTVRTQDEAEELIAAIHALKTMLPAEKYRIPDTGAGQESAL